MNSKKRTPLVFFTIFSTTLVMLFSHFTKLTAQDAATTPSSVVTIQASGSQLFKSQLQPVLVPNKGIIFIRHLINVQAAKLGTGVIVSNKGYIITSAHTLKGLNQVHIVFKDGSKEIGEIIKIFAEHDIAVIRARLPKTAEAALLGDNSELKKGDSLTLVNNPVGKEECVTTGSVKELDKTIIWSEEKIVFRNLIEIGVKVEEGSSGGPAFNKDGTVVGIIALGHIFSKDSTYAIPSNQLKEYCKGYIE
jgi:S1-C subfamily serine protease